QAEVLKPANQQQAAIQEKLNRMTVPNVEFVGTPLQSVVEYLTQVSQQLDASEPDPSKRGVNIVVDPQSVTNVAEAMQRQVTLRLTNAPFETVLKYAAEQVQMKYRVDAYAVTIVPLSAANDTQLITRTYPVPPGFISGNSGGGGGAAAGPVDPFAAPAPGAGGAATLVKRLTAREFLENNGVTFPTGALASFNPQNSTLVVKNTQDNLSLIEQMILSSKEGGAKLIQIDYKLIETSDRLLNEIGFDWLLGQYNIPGSSDIFAGGGSFGNQAANRGAGDYPFEFPGGGPVGSYPVTGGLRSGLARQSGLTIDDVINRDAPTLAGSPAAPGILSVAGVFTDPQVQMVLRGLSQKKGNDLLSTASVVTRPGERAVIKQIREFIYPTEYDPPEIPNQIGGATISVTTPAGGGSFTPGGVAVTPANPAAFETRELGQILEVEPALDADNFTVNLNLITDFSEFSGFINYGSPITGRDQLLLDVVLTPPFFITQEVSGVI
ncbi:MAG: hypothetical protein KC931_22315, partial [Candidatus Omnitrophica bacterium]|nr:hypothetical protein [Candidatus Omnitrophota bacterium]